MLWHLLSKALDNQRKLLFASQSFFSEMQQLWKPKTKTTVQHCFN